MDAAMLLSPLSWFIDPNLALDIHRIQVSSIHPSTFIPTPQPTPASTAPLLPPAEQLPGSVLAEEKRKAGEQHWVFVARGPKCSLCSHRKRRLGWNEHHTWMAPAGRIDYLTIICTLGWDALSTCHIEQAHKPGVAVESWTVDRGRHDKVQ